jgi:hypothetical protein
VVAIGEDGAYGVREPEIPYRLDSNKIAWSDPDFPKYSRNLCFEEKGGDDQIGFWGIFWSL